MLCRPLVAAFHTEFYIQPENLPWQLLLSWDQHATSQQIRRRVPLWKMNLLDFCIHRALKHIPQPRQQVFTFFYYLFLASSERSANFFPEAFFLADRVVPASQLYRLHPVQSVFSNVRINHTSNTRPSGDATQPCCRCTAFYVFWGSFWQ